MQTPNFNDTEYKDYKYFSDMLVLKERLDCPNKTVNRMDYDNFIVKKLNQIGNLKIYYKDKNLADKILLLICYKMVNSIHTKIF